MHSFFYGGRWAGRRFAGPAVAGASMGRLAAFSLLELRSALDSAPLHLVHGLRPMRKGRGYGALMQAWGGIPPSFSRTAHCLRGHYTSNFLICIVRRREEGVILPSNSAFGRNLETVSCRFVSFILCRGVYALRQRDFSGFHVLLFRTSWFVRNGHFEFTGLKKRG